ncbi:M16 family metallopeptidase [Coraliomargarita parva]|uniref:M16 family metallopeptidase n=1 Tax=Coraliomargarita parva TaxID=3014050 RepID=UPI0022B3CC2F|nr:pitrilysin family protein [Coraliomargarita parva]
MKQFLPLLALAFSIACQTASGLPAGIRHVQTLDGIEEYRLEQNGLRVLLYPNEGLPVATVMVTYEVGSRNESLGTTGATHILEHMMFKGTEAHTPEAGNDYSSEMERIGARSNATTYYDRTNYYAILPSSDVPAAIELEADRMRNLRLRDEDLASEMTVVRNEYERGENSPVSTLIKEIFATAYVAHPYNHPVIGWRSDIENTSTTKLRGFYDTFYWPENAVLSVIGGFDKAATLQAVADAYGIIPQAPAAIPEMDTEEPEQLGPRRLIVERSGQVGVVMIAYKVPEGTHPDWASLILIDEILTADKTGRLYRALEDKGKASATFAYGPMLRDPSLFVFCAYLTPDATHEETETIILEEIQNFIENGASEDELARAKSVVRASEIYGRDGPYAIADQLNDAIAMGDWTSYVNLPKAIEAVQVADLQAVAKKYFTARSSTTGWYVPSSHKAMASLSPHRGLQYYREPGLELFEPHQAETDTDNTPPAPGASQVNFSEKMQVADVNGIQVIAIGMPVEGIVSFVGSIAAGDSFSPESAPTLAGMTASMLDKGTQKQDRFAIAEKLDQLGAGISFGTGAHSLSFSGKFLRPDAGAVMDLLAEQLREPAFDPKVLESLKSRSIAGFLQAMDSPDYRAEAELSRLLYEPGHPNYTTPLESLMEGVKGTTVEDLATFHKQYYGPKSLRLVFAGDIDFEQLKAAVASAFDGWEGGVDYRTVADGQQPRTSQVEKITIPDKTSVSVRFGQTTGLQRTAPDYIPFMVGNYILGGSFQSRLNTEVRKNRGLTYHIRSYHEGDILTPGNWALQASFAPSMLEEGITATQSVINEWYAKGVSEAEVRAAVTTLSGSYLVGLSTTASVAGQVHSFVQRGFAPEYIDAYPLQLKGLDAPQVNQAIHQYFDPSALVEVAAGSINAPQPASSSATRKVSVRLDTPDAGWKIRIEKVYQSGDAILVLSKLSHSGEIASQVITTVADSVPLPLDRELPARHYILGKNWNWGDDSSGYQFIDSADAIRESLEGATLLYEAP